MAIFIPKINTALMLRAFFENVKWSQLLASGVVTVGELDITKVAGEYVDIPRQDLAADYAHADVTSTSDMSPDHISTTDDKAVVLRDVTANKFFEVDLIRSAKNLENNWSTSLGEKLAKRMLGQYARMTSACIDKVDTPSADYHIYDGSTNAMTVAILRAGKSKMRDAADELTTIFMHSATWSSLCADIVANYKFDVVGGSMINNGKLNALFGLPNVVISDLATKSGVGTGTTTDDRYTTILSGPGAVQLSFQAEQRVEMDKNILTPSTTVFLKASVDYILHPRGMKWLSSTGGANPTDASYGDAQYWDEAYTDHREVKLVKILTNDYANA